MQVRDEMMSCIEQDGATVTVDEWNPWDWAKALRALANGNNGEVTFKYYMNLFDEIDVDGGGTVDEDELYNALKSAGLTITRDGLTNMIAMVDENANGEIDRKEWSDAVDFFLEQYGAEETLLRGFRTFGRQVKGDKERKFYLDLFDQIDLNKDNLVDENELNRAFNEAGEKVMKRKLKKLIALVDDDNDGKINRKEWSFAVDFFLQHEELRRSVNDTETEIHSELSSNDDSV